jgi:hypothetical protein
MAAGNHGVDGVCLGECALRRKRQKSVQARIFPLDSAVKLLGQLAGRNLPRFERPADGGHRPAA